jgi:UDP-N-acetylglucosamine/UDP-N-acetylgalactosamine 4-epimerase
VAFGASTTLNELYALIKDCVQSIHPETPIAPPVYRDFRKGDVRHSLADITRARKYLDYHPQWTVEQGLRAATGWYAKPAP